MSFASGLTLPDGVLLIADGVVATWREGSENPFDIQTEVDKLEEVDDSIWAVRFGIEQISGRIIERLRGKTYRTPEDVDVQLRSAADIEWRNASLTMSTSSDHYGVGVLVGGLVVDEPFIAAILRHPLQVPTDGKDIFWKGPWAIWAVGFDTDEADSQYYKDVADTVRSVAWKPEDGPSNSLTKLVTCIGLRAIRELDSRDSLTGSVSRSVLVRRRYPVTRRTYNAAE